MTTANKSLIRDRNQQKILETIIHQGVISRADLSKQLGLTKATISSQVQGLLDLGVVEELGSMATRKGRHPILLHFRGSCGYVLSFDISPSGLHVMRANLLGQQCTLTQWDWDGNPDSLLPLLCRIIREAMADPSRWDAAPDSHGPFSRWGVGPGSPAGAPLVGISLAIHGAVHEGRVLFTPYYRLEGLPLKEELQQEFGLPVYLDNEANLSALGERTFSFGASSLINISIHSGIGLGIIMNDRLYTGASGFAGEFGHTIVEPAGRPCPCGNHGCIEQYASIDAILNQYRLGKQREGGTIDDLAADYQRQDPAARAAVADFVKYMAIGINNIANIFNPQLIVINSLLTAYLPDVVPLIRARLDNPMSRDCTIVSSTLQDTATLLGGVAVCAGHYLGIEDFRPAKE